MTSLAGWRGWKETNSVSAYLLFLTHIVDRQVIYYTIMYFLCKFLNLVWDGRLPAVGHKTGCVKKVSCLGCMYCYRDYTKNLVSTYLHLLINFMPTCSKNLSTYVNFGNECNLLIIAKKTIKQIIFHFLNYKFGFLLNFIHFIF